METDENVVECLRAGLHLTDCDDDGYCNHCGNQDGWDYDDQTWEPQYAAAAHKGGL